jgi:hypothetical protein
VNRLSIALVFLFALAALVVGFGVQFNGSDAYPSPSAIDDEYAAYVGDRTHLWTEAVGAENGTLLVETDGLSLRVSAPSPAAVEPGDRVQLYGTIAPDHRFETANYHVQSGDSIVYMYGVSVLGSILAAGLFLRRWRIDVEGRQFVPRGDE